MIAIQRCGVVATDVTAFQRPAEKGNKLTGSFIFLGIDDSE